MKKAIILLVCLVPFFALCAAPAQAQTVNPTTVEFDPSADHDAVSADNQAVVQRYDLLIYLAGASAPVSTASLGKPSAEADGKIRVSLTSVLIGWPLTDGTYEARVAAVGPGGSSASDPSNSFTLTQAAASCTYTLSASSQAFPWSGGSGSVSLTCPSGCTWTASSDAAWVVLGSNGGSGSATIAFTVVKNSTTAARTATLTIGGLTYTVTEAAPNRPTAPKKVRVSTIG